jgi:transposase
MITTDKRKVVFLLYQANMAAREIARRVVLSRNTVRTIIAQGGAPPPPRPRADKLPLDEGLLCRLYQQCQGHIARVHEKLVQEEGVAVAYSTVAQRLRQLGISQPRRQRCDRATEERRHWMHLVLRGGKTTSQIKKDVGDALTGDEITTLLKCVRTKPVKARNRALTLLAHGYGITPGHIASFLLVGRKTARRYISDFKEGGIECVLHRTRKGVRKADDPNYAAAVFKTLHAPPTTFGFNRTTWRMDDLHAVLVKQGVPISKAIIHKIIKAAGYRFRKARRVLTSTDPEYREKLQKIMQILANLKPDEKFFSIDEYGPFSVKIMGGRALTKPGVFRTIPERQKSKGTLIATAALELSTNQVTHFYSEKKNTDEMIRLLEVLISQYRGQTRIFLSWDAASWHGSKKFFGRVDEVNQAAYRAEHGTPVVELAPLPSCAQFLNVIEAVFSGMARAIIHNSDYASVEAAKAAIDRYFAERNDHFQQHPRRAGNKLWGKERVEPEFNEGNNCKDPGW